VLTTAREQERTTFECRPACEATHRVHAIDGAAGMHGYTLLFNVSLSLKAAAPVGVEFWRQPDAAQREAAGIRPPLHRLGLRCKRGTSASHLNLEHSQPLHKLPKSAAQAPGWRTQGTLGSWTLSNSWDAHSGGWNGGEDRWLDLSNADSQDVWSCANGEDGSLELRPTVTEGRRLMSVTLTSHLASPSTRPASQTLPSLAGYIIIAAAWDEMCAADEAYQEEDTPPGEACRTVFTITRLDIETVADSC
jgi:hypothetical protein